jgi:hypothetical protein
MTFYLHKGFGLLPSSQPWSVGLVTSGSITEGAAETAWHSAFTGFWTSSGVAALFSTAVSNTGTSTSTASSSFKQTTKTQTLATHAGTATTQELPEQVAMILTIRSANATKSGHGRLFFPAPVAAALSIGSGGELSSGSLTTISGGFSSIFTSLVSSGLTPLILTRRKTINGQPALSTQQVSSADMPNKLGVQTRRGDKIVPTRTTVTI